jgi:hypothetical protein
LRAEWGTGGQFSNNQAVANFVEGKPSVVYFPNNYNITAQRIAQGYTTELTTAMTKEKCETLGGGDYRGYTSCGGLRVHYCCAGKYGCGGLYACKADDGLGPACACISEIQNDPLFIFSEPHFKGEMRQLGEANYEEKQLIEQGMYRKIKSLVVIPGYEIEIVGQSDNTQRNKAPITSREECEKAGGSNYYNECGVNYCRGPCQDIRECPAKIDYGINRRS